MSEAATTDQRNDDAFKCSNLAKPPLKFREGNGPFLVNRAVTASGSKLIVFNLAGEKDQIALRGAIFDFSFDKWDIIPEPPFQVGSEPVVTVSEQKLYLFGYKNGPKLGVYDLAADEWKEVKVAIHPDSVVIGAAPIDGGVIVNTAQPRGYVSDDDYQVVSYNLEDNTWKAINHKKGTLGWPVKIGREVYYFGGSKVGGGGLAGSHMLDLDSNELVDLKFPPADHKLVGSAISDGRIILWGTQNLLQEPYAIEKGFVFNTKSDEWSPMPPRPEANSFWEIRKTYGAANIKGKVVFWQSDYDGTNAFAFDPEKNAWICAPENGK